MPSCRVTRSRYLTQLSSNTIWVKPNVYDDDIPPCPSTRKCVSILCGQQGSASNPIDLEHVSALIHEVYRHEPVVLIFASGEYGSPHESYIWTGRVSFLGENRDTVTIRGHHTFQKQGGVQQVTFMETVHIMETHFSLQNVAWITNSVDVPLFIENSSMSVNGLSIDQSGPGGAIKNVHNHGHTCKSVWNNVEVIIRNEQGRLYQAIVEGTGTSLRQTWDHWSLESSSHDSCLSMEISNLAYMSCKMIDSTLSHMPLDQEVKGNELLSLCRVNVVDGASVWMTWNDNELRNTVGSVFSYDIHGTQSKVEVTQSTNDIVTENGSIMTLMADGISESRFRIQNDRHVHGTTKEAHDSLYLIHLSGNHVNTSFYSNVYSRAYSTAPLFHGIYQEQVRVSDRVVNCTAINQGTGDVDCNVVSDTATVQINYSNQMFMSQRGCVQNHKVQGNGQFRVKEEASRKKTKEGTLYKGDFTDQSRISYSLTNDFKQNMDPSPVPLITHHTTGEASLEFTSNTAEEQFRMQSDIPAKFVVIDENATSISSVLDRTSNIEGGNGSSRMIKGHAKVQVRRSGIVSSILSGTAYETCTQDNARFSSSDSTQEINTICGYHYRHGSCQPLDVATNLTALIDRGSGNTQPKPLYLIENEGDGSISSYLGNVQMIGVAPPGMQDCPAVVCCVGQTSSSSVNAISITGAAVQGTNRPVYDFRGVHVNTVATRTIANTPCTMMLSDGAQLDMAAGWSQAPQGDLIEATGHSSVGIISCDVITQKGVIISDTTTDGIIGGNTITTTGPQVNAFTNMNRLIQAGNNNIIGANNQVTVVSLQNNPNQFVSA